MTAKCGEGEMAGGSQVEISNYLDVTCGYEKAIDPSGRSVPWPVGGAQGSRGS